MCAEGERGGGRGAMPWGSEDGGDGEARGWASSCGGGGCGGACGAEEAGARWAEEPSRWHGEGAERRSGSGADWRAQMARDDLMAKMQCWPTHEEADPRVGKQNFVLFRQ